MLYDPFLLRARAVVLRYLLGQSIDRGGDAVARHACAGGRRTSIHHDTAGRPADQSLAVVPADAHTRERRRRQVVAGAYSLCRAVDPAVTIAAIGPSYRRPRGWHGSDGRALPPASFVPAWTSETSASEFVSGCDCAPAVPGFGLHRLKSPSNGGCIPARSGPTLEFVTDSDLAGARARRKVLFEVSSSSISSTMPCHRLDEPISLPPRRPRRRLLGGVLALLLTACLVSCGKSEPGARATSPSPSLSKDPLTSCTEQLEYWAMENLRGGPDQGYDYQHMGLSSGQYDELRILLREARALKAKGPLRPTWLHERSVEACLRIRAAPSPPAGGWP